MYVCSGQSSFAGCPSLSDSMFFLWFFFPEMPLAPSECVTKLLLFQSDGDLGRLANSPFVLCHVVERIPTPPPTLTNRYQSDPVVRSVFRTQSIFIIAWLTVPKESDLVTPTNRFIVCSLASMSLTMKCQGYSLRETILWTLFHRSQNPVYFRYWVPSL